MRTFFALAFAACLGWSASQAHAQNVGFALRAGTLGPGVDLSASVSPVLNVRGGAAYFSTTVTETIDEEDVSLALDGDATIGALSLLADYHPFRNSFRLTGGVRLNLFEGQATGRSLDPLCFGDEDAAGNCLDKEFSAEKVGTFGAKVSYESPVQPYAGIGFGNLARGTSRVTFMLDMGVIYAGKPSLELEATGLLTPTATENEAVLNEGLDSFVVYPVFSIGIGFRL